MDCAAFAVTPVTTHGDLNVGNLIGSVPMLVDWECAQLADPVWDLACLSTYYPGLQLRGEELLRAAVIADANGTMRLRLHADLFDRKKRRGHRPAHADNPAETLAGGLPIRKADSDVEWSSRRRSRRPSNAIYCVGFANYHIVKGLASETPQIDWIIRAALHILVEPNDACRVRNQLRYGSSEAI